MKLDFLSTGTTSGRHTGTGMRWPRVGLSALFSPSIVCFVVFLGLLLHLFMDVRVIFWLQSDKFLCNTRFLQTFLITPGGAVELVSKLILQSCHYGWPGVVMIALLAWVLCVVAIRYTMAIDKRMGSVVWVPLAIILLVLQSYYSFEFQDVVAVILALSLGVVYARVSVCVLYQRLLLFSVLFAICYYLAGSACCVFAICSVVYEGLYKRRYVLAILLVFGAIGVKLGLDALFAWPHTDLLQFPAARILRYQSRILQVGMLALYACVPVCAILVILYRYVTRKSGKEDCPSVVLRSGMWHRVFSLIVLLLVAGIAAHCFRTTEARTVLLLHYAADNRSWEDVLIHARGLSPDYYTHYVSQDVNQALYHMGRLPYDMFAYPQRNPVFLGNDPRLGVETEARKVCDLYCRLGLVNSAEHWAHEEFEMMKSSSILKRLAYMKMIKRQPGIARIYLNVLRDDLVYGRWAKDYLHHLDLDPALSNDREMAQIRKLMIHSEGDHPTSAIVDASTFLCSRYMQLSDLLDKNPHNRMAFEYLMAACLFDKNLKLFINVLPRLDSLSYVGTPALYEQAMVIHAHDLGAKELRVPKGVTLWGRRISADAMEKYRKLNKIAVEHGGLNEAAKGDVMRELGDTYFYFYVYGHGGGR